MKVKYKCLSKKGVIFMANTSAVYARIDTNLKDSAESILSQLGISPSTAIQMLYSQVVLTRGFPFQPVLPTRRPKVMNEMSRAELDAELSKGIASVNNGDVHSLEEMDRMFSEEFGL